jgi:hypothetical protein
LPKPALQHRHGRIIKPTEIETASWSALISVGRQFERIAGQIRKELSPDSWGLLCMQKTIKQNIMNNKWSKLSHLQLGKYGEYFAKMEFTKAGFDVYTSEVDDKGIDFIIRKDDNEHYDIQVKSARNNNYVFMRKEVFNPRKNLLLALLLFEDGSAPTLCLVPSIDWKNKKHPVLVEKNYEGKKSKPEWGLNMNKANADEFKKTYSFEKQVAKI